MKKLAIDIDEVLCELLQGYLDFYEEQGFGKKVNLSDVYIYEFYQVLQIDEQLSYDIFDLFKVSEHFSRLKPVFGSKEALTKLSQHFELFFITARPYDLKEQTLTFLYYHFGIKNPNLFFSGEVFENNGKTKDEICRDLGISIIIEDSSNHSIAYAHNGMVVLLLDKPWNQKVEHENITRFSSWNKIVTFLEDYND